MRCGNVRSVHGHDWSARFCTVGRYPNDDAPNSGLAVTSFGREHFRRLPAVLLEIQTSSVWKVSRRRCIDATEETTSP